MSYRKLDKRKRASDGDDVEDYSTSAKYSQKKRSKDEQELAEKKTGQQQPQNTYHYVKETGIRRSSRTPKPKVFDDEDTVASGRSTEGNLKSMEASTSASPNVPRKDRSSVKKQARADDSTFEIGHKRETRRSYQKYLEELGQETDVFSKQNRDPPGREVMIPWSETKATKSHSLRKKSESDDQPHVDTTPPSKGTKQKMSQELGGSCSFHCKKETLDEFSPKLRTSSRTPVPKRIFSLLEGEKVGQNLEESESNKVRASARNYVPKTKKTFLLVEEEELNKSQHIEVKREPLVHLPPKTRIPKTQGTKRSLASTEEERIPNPVHNTPEIFTEPSPQRVSSRGHVPKKTFSLLEDQEDVSDSKKHVTTGVKWDKHKGCQEEQMTKVNNSQQNSEGREPKRQKSTHGHQSVQSQSSSQEGNLQLSNYGHEKSDLVKHSKLLVEPDHIKTKNYFIEEHVALISKRNILETPKTSKESMKRNNTSTNVQQEGQVKRINKRKGKPVKKIGLSSDVLPVKRPPTEFDNVKVKMEVSSDNEILETSKQIAPKRSNKKRQVDHSVSNTSSLPCDISSVKMEDVEHKPAFSLSELVTNVINSKATSEVQGESNLKVQKHKKGKLSKKDAQKADKSSENVLNKSATKASVQEHIILKLHLPHSEESSRHKKHHKHKHSSSSHDSSSPKKTHHKKPSAKSLENTQSLETKQEETKKNKKISIKFKGLSSNRIDFEVPAESLEPGKVDDLPACLNDTNEVQSSKHSMEGERKKKKLKHTGSQDKQLVLMSPPVDGEHVKLVIKKDKLPLKSKHGVNEKSSKVKPKASKVQDHEKETTKVVTTRKGKVCSTSKTKKTAQVCLTMGAHILMECLKLYNLLGLGSKLFSNMNSKHRDKWHFLLHLNTSV